MHANDIAAIPIDSLPSILREVAEVTDVETALKVAEQFGGKRCYFPFEPKPDHSLSRVVGHDMAVIICQAIVPGIGMELLVPLGPTDFLSIQKRKIRNLIMAGYSCSAVASAVGVHSRTVQNHRNKMLKEGIALPTTKFKNKLNAPQSPIPSK